MVDDSRQRDADLIAYYRAEASDGRRRSQFAALLDLQARRRLVDVGAGPGLDTTWWRSDGFTVTGLDLAHANV